MGVRNLVIIDFRSYLRQHCDVTISRKNTCNTVICRSIQCLQVLARRLCRISFHFAGIRSRSSNPDRFSRFSTFSKIAQKSTAANIDVLFKEYRRHLPYHQSILSLFRFMLILSENRFPKMRKIIFV